MPAFCLVLKCSMRAERDKVSFFRFPAVLTNRGDYLNAVTSDRRNAWIRSLKRGPLTETQLKNGRVCSRHFISGKPASLEDKNNPDWIPNQNMGYLSGARKTVSDLTRYKRTMKRAQHHDHEREVNTGNSEETVDHIGTSVPGCSYNFSATEENISSTEIHGDSVGVSVQTDLTVEVLCNSMEELKCRNSEIYTLKSKLETMELNENSFRNKDSKTLYFTGLPKAEMLFILHEDLLPYLPSHANNVLTTFQQLLLTLMKLRLNLPLKYLSYQFTVSPTTASETFLKCLHVLYERLKTFVEWPEREELQKNVPECFKVAFGNKVAVIIDCFEVFTERPSSTLNAARCWSNYKHHETIKFLIGISPQGVISFISKAWGGRSSDKYITENCGFLDNILPGDIILADRGFLIDDAVRIKGGKLIMPAFTKGQSQLHPLDLEKTRNIATVRIHVERVIGYLKKKFMILHETLPISIISYTSEDNMSALDKIVVVCSAMCPCMDKIVVVCSAIINMGPSQIPLR